jgi:hypothetical protein
MTEKDNGNKEPLVSTTDDGSSVTPKVDSSSSSSKGSSWQVPQVQLPNFSNMQKQVSEFPQRVSEMRIPSHWEEHLESGMCAQVTIKSLDEKDASRVWCEMLPVNNLKLVVANRMISSLIIIIILQVLSKRCLVLQSVEPLA